MKKLLSTLAILTLVLVCIFVLPTRANAASSSDLTFELNEDGKSYSVTDCKESASGKLTIPSTYNGKPVTTIGEKAFEYCRNITSVTIPDSVTTIGISAFESCSSVTSLTIGKNVATIGGSAFRGCYGLTSITIPSKVIFIGYYAFNGCTGLVDVTFDNCAVSVEDNAFEACSNLVSVTIPDTAINMGYAVFKDCSKLNYTTYNGAKYLGNASNPYLVLIDAGPSTITSLQIHENTKLIGGGAFLRRSKLTQLTVPDNVTAIGDSAFAYSENLKTVTLPNGLVLIDELAFYGCAGLTTLKLPSTVTTIGQQAFFDCDSLTALVIPEKITRIERELCSNCDALTSVTIPNGVTIICEGAFYSCDKITSLTLPKSLTTIEHYAFQYCSSLSSITIPNSVTTIESWAFDNCTGVTTVTIPDSATTIGWNAFGNCPIKKFIVAKGSKTITATMVVGENTVEEVVIPDTVTTIGYSAFSNCVSLTTVTIPNSVTTIEQSAFENCSSLTSLTIPNSVATIESCAFASCQNLVMVSVPDSITFFGDNVFADCPNLMHNTYNKGRYLGNSSNPYVILKDTTSEEITSFQIHKQTKVIGSYALYNCKQLTSVTIPSGVTCIGEYAFGRCNSLTSASIPDSVKTIGYCAFTDCGYITTVTIGKNVTIIDDLAFNNCYRLEDLTIGKSVTTIGNKAFNNCFALTDVQYMGTSTMWNKIHIEEGNDKLTNAAFCFAQYAKINTQPQNTVAQSGKQAKVTVSATGDGLTYTWYFKNKGASSYSKSSITTNTYTMTMDANRAGRQIYCVVKDKYGNSVKSNVVTLYMGNPLKITKQPANVSAFSGATIKTSVTASGDGLTYTWYYKNKDASSYSKSSITTKTYSATMDSTREGRQVYCVVKDKWGSTIKTNVVTLSMKRTAKITTQPKTAAAPKGKTVKTTISATGDGLTYTWYFKNKGASSYSKSSITTNAYTMTADSTRNGRTVYCVVKDKYGNSVKSNVVTLYMGNPAKITKQLANVTVATGSAAKTTITASGDGITYTWYIKNKGATAWSKSSVTGTSYSVTMKSTVDGRQVYCVVKDKYGTSVKSNVITLTMKNPLKITKQPTNVTVASGATAKTSVTATGDGLSYTWYYKNKTASGFTKSSITTNTYTTTMDSTRAGRQVFCVVKDKYGNTLQTSIVTLNKK